MRIELHKQNDTETLINIWYTGSIQAHDFINQEYWLSQKDAMKNKYFPMAETYVIYNQAKIAGFVSMVENYLAALFIDTAYQRSGYGKELLDFIKTHKTKITLKVYKENTSATRFYEKNGFKIVETLVDEHTDHEEYLMEWKKS
ncbi:N-acetyltransferase [Paenibacillus xylanilyticus]|uniref:N-acetyltransferase n=1 Tax=Paenibacillus xylanilyticus TaxID=248903 RepID=UPI0039A1E01B